MATNEPKKRSIVANLVANMLTEREDDFTANVTYVANRSIGTSSSMSVFHSPKRKRNRRNSLSLPLKFHCDRFYSL